MSDEKRISKKLGIVNDALASFWYESGLYPFSDLNVKRALTPSGKWIAIHNQSFGQLDLDVQERVKKTYFLYRLKQVLRRNTFPKIYFTQNGVRFFSKVIKRLQNSKTFAEVVTQILSKKFCETFSCSLVTPTFSKSLGMKELLLDHAKINLEADVEEYTPIFSKKKIHGMLSLLI
jgi:hypothetical protein